MTQVPLLREMIRLQGCLLLTRARHGRSHKFFPPVFPTSTTAIISSSLGILPEGASPIVLLTASRQVGLFSPGFTHLALRVTGENLMVFPVAISWEKERVRSLFPIRTLKVFDPSPPWPHNNQQPPTPREAFPTGIWILMQLDSRYNLLKTFEWQQV